ncbi:MAG: hypothetical protein EKK57_07575 [Proteobacteria bacterium]|nr:MAG: hypothetical protein EKK57_07575 [Pseudomonadota bacterium]
MKKATTSLIVSTFLLLILYLSVSADTQTIDVPVQVNQVGGVYVYTFDKVLTATSVQIIYSGYTATFTTTGTTIPLTGLVITSPFELVLSGYAETITMIESENPDEPYIQLSSIEDLNFKLLKFFNKIYLPTIAH